MPTSRLDKLRARRMDPLIKVAGTREAYERLPQEGSAVKYTIGTMQPIDPGYAQRTIDERDRVERQLADGFRTARLDVGFEYQGSVTNDTSVRIYSDVDLLTVDGRSFNVQPPNVPTHPYAGDPVSDLRQIRLKSAEILRSAFPAATIDQSGGKCINISGGSLRRRIDVIASNWWHTVEYVRTAHKEWLGVQILDYKKNQRIPNKPFLHNLRIEEKDIQTGGGLRKVIRLLKSVRYDSDDKIELASYDIAGIAYNMPPQWLIVDAGYDLQLAANARDYLRYLLDHHEYRNGIDVPNGTRKVFGSGGATEISLKQLSAAVDGLVGDIDSEMNRSLRKLREARITY